MAGFGPVVGVYGNHELAGDLDIYNRLSARNTIEFHAAPTVVRFSDVAVACLPWPRKAQLLAHMPGATVAAGANAMRMALGAVLGGLGGRLQEQRGRARVALAHVMIDGSRTDHDQPLVGADLSLSLADLALLGADIYACGHVHAQQDGRIGDAPWLFGGSPRHNNFGEPGPKGYVIIDVDGGAVRGWERVATPATPMLLLSSAWSDGGLPISGIDSVRGTEVRLRYRVPADERESARACAYELRDRMLGLGAVTVTIEEEVTTERRARAPEVAAARTLPDRLERHWEGKGFDPGERRPSLLEKTALLQAESEAA
jgi:DNA repair exonuclease SbcCD nuclease subunit